MINRNPWNRCQECGRFVSFHDLSEGKALYQELTPSSYYTFETWELVCSKCLKKDLGESQLGSEQ